MEGDKITLSIFLVRENRIADLEKALLPDGAPEMIEGFDGRVAPFASAEGPPAWQADIRQLMKQPESLTLNTQTAGVVLLIRKDNLYFAVTAGTGWQRLKDEFLVADFGRRVALVAIPREEVVAVSLEQVFARWHTATERAPSAAPLDQFSVESDRDLVSAIEGKPSPKHAVLGKVIRGSTSLRVKIPIRDLQAVLTHAGDLYRDGDYGATWPEMDNLMPIRNESEIAECEAALDTILKGVKPERYIIMSAPAARKGDTQAAESYVFGRNTRTVAIAPFLSFGSWLSHLKRSKLPPTVETARRTSVHLLDENKGEFSTCTVFDCFGCEMTVKGRVVVLSSGIWYQVAHKFIARINKTASGLAAPKYLLPAWDGAEREGAYNERCATNRKELLLFDVKLISFGGGASRFEFCDLMHPTKQVLYFVKIPSRSSDLSHLVEQTRRTVELLFDPDGDFRTKLKAKIRKEYPKYNTSWLDERPKPGEWELCLVALGREAKDMPMFAKCSIARIAKEMRRLGHQISFQAP